MALFYYLYFRLDHRSHGTCFLRIARKETEANLPVRMEPHLQFAGELRRLQTGLFSPAHVHTLLQEVATSEDSEYVARRVDGWSQSLAKFSDSVSEEFASYVDLWSLGCWAISEAIEALEVLHLQALRERTWKTQLEHQRLLRDLDQHQKGETVFRRVESGGEDEKEPRFVRLPRMPMDFQSQCGRDFYSFVNTCPEEVFLSLFRERLLPDSDDAKDNRAYNLDFYVSSLQRLTASEHLSPASELALLPCHLRALDASWHRLQRRDQGR